MNKIKKQFLTILAGMALCAPGSGQVISIGKGDLIFSFKAAGGSTGELVNYEVNLGSNTNFTATTSSWSLQLSATDLETNYGVGWANRTDLSFGVIGAAGRTGPIGGAANQYWASANASDAGTFDQVASTPFVRKSSGATNGISAAIEALYDSNNTGSLNGATAITGFSNQALINATATGSFTKQKDGASATTVFGGITPIISFGTPLNAGTSAYSDLYSVLTGSGNSTLVGTFTLTDVGVLSFVGVSAIPEPSTYAAILGSLTLAIVALRRRNRSKTRT